MPTLLYKETGLVKGIRFDSRRRVGALMQAVKVYNLRQVDELVFLDIAATREGRRPDFELIDEFADECFMPLTVGGGIRSVEDVGRVLAVGADKVALNTAALEVDGLVAGVAEKFGSQCVVASLDVKRRPGGGWEAWTRSGTRPTGLDAVEAARRLASAGAGELLLTSIDRDGTMEGYDVDLVRAVSSIVGIPVIASGGAGNYEQMAEVVRAGGASAVAAASIFHFTEQTPLEAKRYLKTRGFPVRA